MVSIMYLGEIVRLVLVRLTKEKLLFKAAQHQASSLQEKGSISGDYISLIESDMSEEQVLTKFVLEKLQVKNYSEEDCRIVRYVCGIVLERAAYLAAAGLAALIKHTGQSGITIAIDGPSLKTYHPHFHQLMNTKTQQLVGPELRFKIVSTYNGSARGAALVAAAVFGKPPKKTSQEPKTQPGPDTSHRHNTANGRQPDA